MTRYQWQLKFRRCRTPETLEKVYEHLCFTGNPAHEFTMTQTYDHRKAELAAGKLFDRVPGYLWHYVR
ncbi:Hha/YmoA family nucleoid-associated regulatory protein [Pantoea agglomerans]|uniref:Hha/YmoA family nucleoid-associated regulatory protein n=1 Tax=Enterobacter agglomerans TaxID=549 RepID=UPI00387F2917